MNVLVNILLFLIINVILFGYSKLTTVIDKNMYLLLATVIFSAMLFTIFKLSRKTFESFFFQVTPAKKCCIGKFGYDLDPELKKLCESIPQEEINRVCPGEGMIGRPMRMGCCGSINSTVNG